MLALLLATAIAPTFSFPANLNGYVNGFSSGNYFGSMG
jgi:hypothetical protein